MDRLKTAWSLIRGMMRRMEAADLSLVAAGGAFFVMLSLFPGLAAIVAVLGFFADPAIVDQQMALLADFIPDQAYGILQSQITRLVETNSSVLGWTTGISTLAALWSARRGTDALIKALNRIFNAPIRGGVRSALVAVLITAALIMVVIVALLTMVVLPLVLAFLPLGPLAGYALEAARWLVAVIVVLSGIWVLYRFAPTNSGARVRWLSPGAALAVIVWGIASAGFSVYLTRFAAYNEVYGSIGAVIALLMFLYITIFTVLLGATLNAELRRRRLDAEEADQLEQEAGSGVSGPVPAGAATPITSGIADL